MKIFLQFFGHLDTIRATMKTITTTIIAFLLIVAVHDRAFGQAEVPGWGNIRGIRVGGELVEFGTAVGVFNPDFSQLTLSQREGPITSRGYVRDGNTVTVTENLRYGAGGFGGRGGAPRGGATTTNPAARGARAGGRAGGAGGRGGAGAAGGFSYNLAYTDSASGVTEVKIDLTSNAAEEIGGVYYFLVLPSADFGGASAQLIGGQNANAVTLATPDAQGEYLSGTATGIRVSAKNGEVVEADFPQALKVVVQQTRGRNSNGDIQVYFPIITGNTTAGQMVTANFTLKASGPVDTTPVTVSVDPSKPGRIWDGIGGNYRIQDATKDPLHIKYIMDNMRVAYGRVALPWGTWQPNEDEQPPLLAAASGQAPANGPAAGRGGRGGGGAMMAVQPAFDIAHTLAEKNIPMIISVWFPPAWANLQNPNAAGGRGGRGGGGGRARLDPAKWDAICKSLGSYLVYLRDHYGAEPRLFSFNESNIGINVLQTPEDHDEAIKKLGAYFKSIGLKTKMLLGDTGDAPPINFIQVALNDPEAAQYIGAVSFHSWRGATDAQYQAWADAATKLGVPLIDAEGGNDAQASSYPNIFVEPWYSLDEAAEYTRIMNICQPEAILEWQLTENYSVLSTDANGELHPTQRFYNLKQFNLAPAGSAWIPAKSSSDLVLPAANMEASKGICTVNLVNNGAARQVTITGLPASLTELNVYTTNHDESMKKQDSVKVTNGSAKFTLEGDTFTTLTNAAP